MLLSKPFLLSILLHNNAEPELHKYIIETPWNYYIGNDLIRLIFPIVAFVIVFVAVLFIGYEINSNRKRVLRWFRKHTIIHSVGVVFICAALYCFMSNVVWKYCIGEKVFILLIIPIAAFLLLCVFLWEQSVINKRVWKFFSKHLKGMAIFVLLAGFVLYFIGYSQKIEEANLTMIISSTLQAGGRALLSSMGMFVFDTDFIEVEKAYHHNIVFLVAYAIIHLLGILVTTHVILRLLGERFLSNRRMSRILNKNAQRDIFVFWGVNEESIILAESIKKKYDAENEDKKNIKKFVLLFVETPSEKELEIKEHSLSHFFESSIHGSSEKDQVEDLDGIILYPKRRLVDVEKELSMNERNDLPEIGEDIFEKLGLLKLFELCNESYDVSFFFLSDDEQKNIQDTLIIQGVFREKTKDGKLHLYCKSRDNYANRAIINAEGLFVTKLIDDASLSIKVLKEMQEKDIPTHPINYVSVDDEKGVVKSSFTSLLLGFGTTGQDALRFLYEYGIFIKSSGEISPFKCYIIDREMNKIKGQFFREVPMLGSDNQPESMKNIEFWNCDWNSEEFKEKFTSEMLDELNYVVVATGEDKSNMKITAELYEYVLKNRKDGFENFHIFVRSYNKENENQLEAINTFYKNNEYNDVITVFGIQREIYTYQNIIKDEKKENKAKEFFKIYQQVSDGKDTWEKREQILKNMTIPYADRLEQEHKKGQDYSNVFHMFTKLKLYKYIDRELPDWESFPFNLEEIKDCDERNFYETLNNLSELEHIRWNAAHYMAGFVYAPEKDFRKKKHKCIKPFSKLDNVTKRYDYATVITTIELNRKE